MAIYTASIDLVAEQQANGISSIVEEYALSSSKSSAPTTGWSPVQTAPYDMGSHRYLWNREKITYTDGYEERTTPHVVAMFGRGINNITEGYAVTNSTEQPMEFPYTLLKALEVFSETNKYLWNMEVINYTDGTSESQVHLLAVYGQRGSDSYLLDLDNENDTMLYDNSGTLKSGNVESTATLYKGSAPVSGAVFSKASEVGCTASVDATTGKVTVTAMSATNGYVLVRATYNGSTYDAKLTLKKLVGTVKYDLWCSPSSISYNSSTDAGKTFTIKIHVYKTGIDGVRTKLNSLTGTGLTLKRHWSENTSGTSMTLTNGEASFNPVLSWDNYRISLSDSSGEIDSETIPICKSQNGNNGESPVIYTLLSSENYIYRKENGTLTPNSLALSLLRTIGPETEELSVLPEGFSLEDERTYENDWTSSEIPLGNVSVSDKDGDKLEAMNFTLSNGSTALQTITIRVIKEGQQGPQGINGQSVFTSNLFKRSASKPSTLSSSYGSFSNPAPASGSNWNGWEDGIPASNTNLPLWQIQRIFTSDGKSPQGSWTSAKLVSDTADVDVCYSSSYSKPLDSTLPTAGTDAENDYWHNTPNERDRWKATSYRIAGTWQSWQVEKIQGESGKDAEMVHFSATSQSYGSDAVASLKYSSKTHSGTLSGTPQRGICVLSPFTNEGTASTNDAQWIDVYTDGTSGICAYLDYVANNHVYINSFLVLISTDAITIDDALASKLEKWGGCVDYRCSQKRTAFIFVGKYGADIGTAYWNVIEQEGVSLKLEFDFVNYMLCNPTGSRAIETHNIVRHGNLLNRESLGTATNGFCVPVGNGAEFVDDWHDTIGGCVKSTGSYPIPYTSGTGTYQNLCYQRLDGKLKAGRWYTLSFFATSSPGTSNKGLSVHIESGCVDTTAGYWVECNGAKSENGTIIGNSAASSLVYAFTKLPSSDKMSQYRYAIKFKTASSITASSVITLVFRCHGKNFSGVEVNEQAMVGAIMLHEGVEDREFELALADQRAPQDRARKQSILEADIAGGNSSWLYSGLPGEPYRDVVLKGDSLSNAFEVKKLHKYNSAYLNATSGYFDPVFYKGVVATDLLLARLILASEIDVDNLVAKQMRSANNTFVVDASGNVTANSGTYSSIKANRFFSPWVSKRGATYRTEGLEFDNDNIYSTGASSTNFTTLPNDVSQAGRVIRVASDNFSSSAADQRVKLEINNRAVDQYFYEDGFRKETLTISNEVVELLGRGSTTKFWGWIVLRRIDLTTTKSYGAEGRTLARGRIWQDSNGTWKKLILTHDGESISVSASSGVITMSLPWNWRTFANDIHVMVTPLGITSCNPRVVVDRGWVFETMPMVSIYGSFNKNLGVYFELNNIGDWSLRNQDARSMDFLDTPIDSMADKIQNV